MGRVVTLVLACLGLALHAAPAASQSFVVADEAQMQQMVNAARASRGLPPLQVLGQLVKVAREQSTRMNDQQRLFHNLNLGDDIRALGLDPSWHGENVVVAPDIVTGQEAFMKSPGHYENIVRPNYNAFGVGVVADTDGTIWATQVFAEIKGNSAPAAPTDQAPAPTQSPPPPPPSPPPPTPKPTVAPTPAPTPTAAPVSTPVAPVAIENGIVASVIVSKTEEPGRTSYLAASALISVVGSAIFAIVLAPRLRRSRRQGTPEVSRD